MASFGEEQEACLLIRVDNKPFDGLRRFCYQL
jgi:hypothetical protein